MKKLNKKKKSVEVELAPERSMSTEVRPFPEESRRLLINYWNEIQALQTQHSNVERTARRAREEVQKQDAQAKEFIAELVKKEEAIRVFTGNLLSAMDIPLNDPKVRTHIDPVEGSVTIVTVVEAAPRAES